MILDPRKEFLNESLRQFIINNNSKEYLVKYKCKVCNGTGLKNTHELGMGGFSWQGEYCDFCEGIGYLNPKEITNLESGENLYCYICNGTGVDYNGRCKVCDGTGIINWLKNIIG